MRAELTRCDAHKQWLMTSVGEGNADGTRGEHPIPAGVTFRTRIAMKRESLGDGSEHTNTNAHRVAKEITGETTPSGHAVAVTTQEATDGFRENAVRIANVERNMLNWVTNSSAGVLDMTNCDFIVRSARDEIKQILGSCEPDVIIGSDKDQSRGCRRKHEDHVEFLCELHGAQVACGRYLVHEQTVQRKFEIDLRDAVMATPGTRTLVADLCMLGFAACDVGGPGRCQHECADCHHCKTSGSAECERREMNGLALVGSCWYQQHKRQ